ncbi:MAG: ferritin-like domain-containing protein [Pseudomonadota bacterium]|nr:ferritin-like domain-containing protein [Pseudomonadota bacterium]
MEARFNHDTNGAPLLDLRRAGAARRPDLSTLPELSDAERQTAIRTWRGRMVNEHLSAQVWASLVPQLMRAAIPPELLTSLPAAAADELRHAEQCAGVVLALGGEAVAPLPEILPLPEHADVGPLEAALRNVISVGCMSETIAVSIIRAEQAELEGGPLGDVLGTILADEIKHARFGWTVLGLLAPRLDDASRARLSAYLVDAFVHQVTYEVPKLPIVAGRRPELAEAGVCDGGFARDLFVDTIETIIVPGLAQAGLAAADAWQRARIETAHIFAA